MSEIKLCKDCKHCRPARGFLWLPDYAFARCANPVIQRAISVDPVTGRHENGKWWYCSVARMDMGGLCNAEGRHWEPKRGRERAA